jgi:hypothetical protein
MESGHWPSTLKNKKQPLATRNSYFCLGGGNAAIAVTRHGWMYFRTRPQPAARGVEKLPR